MSEAVKPTHVKRAAAPNELVPVGPEDPSRFLNRDLQWLEFNRRVLAQALDPRNPLLERVRFLAIFGSNLDEFFMKRVGGLRRQIDAGVGSPPWEPLSPAEQLVLIRERVLEQTVLATRAFRETLVPLLDKESVELLGWNQLTDTERIEAERWYRRNIFPILTPLAVDPGHRFPFISNMSISLGVLLRRPGESEALFARVKVPEIGGKLYRFGSSRRFISLQDIIAHNLDDLFPGMEIVDVLPFRVTRNAETERDNEDAEDLLEQIQQQLRERRFARVVRLETERAHHALPRGRTATRRGWHLRDRRHARLGHCERDRRPRASRAALAEVEPGGAARPRGRQRRHLRDDPCGRHPRASPLREL
jgi:polyphosphate kinase